MHPALSVKRKMVRILIRNLGKSINVTDLSKSLLSHMQDQRIDWMHSCGGKGRCTTCKARIVQGIENLEPLTPVELKYKKQGMLRDNDRLACQVKARGDVILEVPDDGKLPHMTYLD
jgi:2Fe-2S ferredoxin